MIQVLVADDQTLIRQAVVSILDAHPEISVVGQAENGAQAVDLAEQLRPDVVLMDIRMPVLDGIEATRRICAATPTAPPVSATAAPGPADADEPLQPAPETRVLILTTFEEEEYVVAALKAGASGFIGKGAEPEEITRAILAIQLGETLLSSTATRDLIRRYVLAESRSTPIPSPAAAEVIAGLTEREAEVLLLVARGLSNQDIAGELFISPHTAKTHVNRIMTKVGAHDRAQLVILAYEGGLLIPGATG